MSISNPFFSILSGRDTFSRIRNHTCGLMVSSAQEIQPLTWQGMDVSNKPGSRVFELMNYSFTHDLQSIEDLQHWRDDVKPNLPWADDHFEERVCGAPINPGIQWENWPWGASADGHRDEDGMFNHNYMERYWPRHAGQLGSSLTAEEFSNLKIEAEHGDGVTARLSPNRGIRNAYGDLNDLIEEMVRDPQSRQHYLPIFFPEDVGEVVGGRKPCSLGYQFTMRDNRLHVYYPMRSCDFAHHMQDDIYLTIRLLLWVLDRCRDFSTGWDEVTPGTLTLHCTSLHVFENDMIRLERGSLT